MKKLALAIVALFMAQTDAEAQIAIINQYNAPQPAPVYYQKPSYSYDYYRYEYRTVYLPVVIHYPPPKVEVAPYAGPSTSFGLPVATERSTKGTWGYLKVKSMEYDSAKRQNIIDQEGRRWILTQGPEVPFQPQYYGEFEGLTFRYLGQSYFVDP